MSEARLEREMRQALTRYTRLALDDAYLFDVFNPSPPEDEAERKRAIAEAWAEFKASRQRYVEAPAD